MREKWFRFCKAPVQSKNLLTSYAHVRQRRTALSHVCRTAGPGSAKPSSGQNLSNRSRARATGRRAGPRPRTAGEDAPCGRGPRGRIRTSPLPRGPAQSAEVSIRGTSSDCGVLRPVTTPFSATTRNPGHWRGYPNVRSRIRLSFPQIAPDDSTSQQTHTLCRSLKKSNPSRKNKRPAKQ